MLSNPCVVLFAIFPLLAPNVTRQKHLLIPKYFSVATKCILGQRMILFFLLILISVGFYLAREEIIFKEACLRVLVDRAFEGMTFGMLFTLSWFSLVVFSLF